MSRSKSLIAQWKQVVKPGELASLAREARFGERERKITPRRLFWGLLMGFGCHHQSENVPLAGRILYIR